MNLSKYYAQALFDLTHGKLVNEKNEIVSSLVAVLKKKGHEKLLQGILREYGRIEGMAKDKDSVVLTVARSSDALKFKNEIKRYMKKEENDSRRSTQIQTIVDGTMIGGFRFITRDTIVDGSYKRQLLDLYRNITT